MYWNGWGGGGVNDLSFVMGSGGLVEGGCTKSKYLQYKKCDNSLYIGTSN